jgi:YqaJ-like viral recombinase domain
MFQGTNEWRQARCGSIGASDAPRVVRKIKSGGYSADRESLMAEKLLERLTGVPFEGFKSAAMLQGTEREPEARMTYELVRGVEVEEVGLIPHHTVKGSHASPDGLIGLDGLVELKCPQAPQHLALLLGETINGDYITQVQWQMACAGRAWCDVVSYCPSFPPAMRLWVRRVPRDAKFIGELEREITQFIREIDQKVDRLSARYAMAA